MFPWVFCFPQSRINENSFDTSVVFLQFFGLETIQQDIASTQSLSFLSWIRGFHVYKGWWTPHNGESLQLQPEPDNPKDQNAVSVVKDSRVVGHMPLMLVNTKERLGLIRHFLAKPGTSGVVGVCGKAVNRGRGLGMEIPCEYVFTGPLRSYRKPSCP